MNKLLTTAAVCGLIVAANPALANIDLELGGYYKGYAVYNDQDEPAGSAESREFDYLSDTELHAGGEATLDNGLTVGFHAEAEIDGADAFDVEESYLYMSGAWGRLNVGAEDGAAYLLQVAAPSADSNYDGIRQYIQPVNYSAVAGLNAGLVGAGATVGTPTGVIIDYAQDPTAYADKLTYLSPVMAGFQLGLSYVPDVADTSTSELVNTDDVVNVAGSAYEAGLRYEGQYDMVGFTLGAGYSLVTLEDDATSLVAVTNQDDRDVWNVGLDLDFGPFGIGAVYKEDNNFEAVGNDGDEETLVVGADYTTGPFKIGVSYMDQENTFTTAVDTKRYTGGVTYTYGPGMTFRGSISQVEHDNAVTATGGDFEATTVLVGTQVNF